VLAGLFRPERYDSKTGMDPGELAASLTAGGVPADYIPDVEKIVAVVTPDAKSGDILLVMSNGGFGGIHGKLLEALKQNGG
jgi:UDP-N-acetylmuramate: L-alanyl-gamma-D-glutamyl-meso-diaminopimelate ligase